MRSFVLVSPPRSCRGYLESWFCLMELGATWAMSHNPLPIVVPPVEFGVIAKTLGLKQGWSINDHSKLNELKTKIAKTGIALEHRGDDVWDKKRAVWKADLSRILKSLPSATSVPASDFESLGAELASVQKELADLQEAFADAQDTIDQLKAAKDPAEVEIIMASKTGFDPEQRLSELLKEVSRARPKVSMFFYRNMLLDLYGRAAAIDWVGQRDDAEAAIKYKLMSRDPPHTYSWGTDKMKRIESAVKAVEAFLSSGEAEEFVSKSRASGNSMDVDDLEFWEENLPR